MTNPADGMAKGIGYGALAATAAFLSIMLLTASGPLDWAGLYVIPLMAMAIFAIALILISLVAMLAGYPIVWMLGRIGCVCAEVGGILGAVSGACLFLVPALISGTKPDSLLILLALTALVGGGVTGWVWGGDQERLGDGDADPPHPNRIDDPRILR